MSPAIIADSDDEGEDQDLSTVPITRRGDILQLAGQPQTGSSDSIITLPTSSTDPAHFQSVYREQIAAARQQQLLAAEGGGGGGGGGSDALMTPHEGTQQTWEATDPVSLPSQYVNIHTVGGDRSGLSSNMRIGHGENEVQLVGTGGADPWEVPSSPEKETKKAGSKRVKSNTTSRPLSVDRSFGNGTESWDAAPPAKKRRMGQGEDENVDFDERQAMDQELQNGTAGGLADGSLPPTMPMGDPSLVITTQPLSNSQKMQYKSVELPSSRPEDTEQLSQQQSPTKEADGSQPEKKTRQKATPKKATKKRQPKKKQQNLSEEIIVQEESETIGGTTQGDTGRDDAGIPDAQRRTLPDTDDEAYDETVMLGTQAEDEEAIVLTAKPKKRGRPKKAATDETRAKVAGKAGPDAPQPTDTKKKRGRPKKQKAPEAIDAAQPIASTEDTKAEEGQEVRLDDAPAADTQHCVTGAAAEEETTEVPDTKPSIEEKAAGTEVAEADGQDAKDGKPCKDSNSLGGEATKASRGKQPATGKPIMGADGKTPLYRVGLSRRSRIAPLLKIMRK